ncbi:MAG: dihydroorotase [Candidatus Omnitrophica bacterium]|nr:dihydroorotase [Candidatus Omnitrophota bacterium]
MKLLIKGGRVIDPGNDLDDILDILVDGGKIAKVARNIALDSAEAINAEGKVVIPGLVDMHVHLREPGREDKETVFSGTKAALKGGVTSVLAMPNTSPAMDCAETLKLLKDIIKKTAQANVFIAAAITRGRAGEQLNDIASLKEAGAVAISDDGSSVDKEEVLLEAFKRSGGLDILVVCHCEDKSLSGNGVMNLGFVSTRMGLRGISRESEYRRVERDIELAGKAGARVHIAHVSCKETVEIIAHARKKGVKVTAETAPHYFSLSEEALARYNTNMKINPPLRSREDVAAIRHGLKAGTIDAIASDHAPHTESEKDIEFDRAEFGAIGLETELAVGITELVESGLLNLPELVRKMSLNPAKILGIDRGTLSAGSAADIAIIDPGKKWTVKKEDFISKSKNSPFIGMDLEGVVEYTILSGNVAYKR